MTQPSDYNNFGPWIDWAGGECPIPDAKAGEYGLRFKDGSEDLRLTFPAIWWSGPFDCWKHEAEELSIIAYRVRIPADDLLKQAVEALRGLVQDDLTYDGRIIKIECVNHTDAIAKVIAARAVVILAAERGL